MFMRCICAALQQAAVRAGGEKSSPLILFLLSPLSWPQKSFHLSVWQPMRPGSLPQHILRKEARNCFFVLSPSNRSYFRGAAEGFSRRTESAFSSPLLMSSTCSLDFIQLLSSSWAIMRKQTDDFTCLKKYMGKCKLARLRLWDSFITCWESCLKWLKAELQQKME